MESVIKKIGLLILIVALLSFGSVFVAVILSFAGDETALGTGNVAVIPINGVISTEDAWGTTVDPAYVRSAIERADANDAIKAIVIEINSPGGAVVATDEIGQAVQRAGKPTVAWIREYGASGGYWIASNTDYIIANRMSITGSIGVTASYIEFAGTLRRFNATYQEVKSGEYKEMGSPWTELSPQEEQLLQRKIDKIHEFFIEEVQENRNLTNKTMQQVRTGEIFLGVEAYDLGLVDEVGSYPEVDAYVETLIGEKPQYVRYEKQVGFLESLALLKSSFVPGVETGLNVRA